MRRVFFREPWLSFGARYYVYDLIIMRFGDAPKYRSVRYTFYAVGLKNEAGAQAGYTAFY